MSKWLLYVSFNFKGLSQQIPNKRLWAQKARAQKHVSRRAHFSAIFNLSFSEEVFCVVYNLDIFYIIHNWNILEHSDGDKTC